MRFEQEEDVDLTQVEKWTAEVAELKTRADKALRSVQRFAELMREEGDHGEGQED